MGKLEGKVAVITGGSSGMALASAKRFVEEGAYVFITGRRQEALDEAVKLIGRNVTGVRGDAANLDDLDRQSGEKVLDNCGGVLNRRNPLIRQSEDCGGEFGRGNRGALRNGCLPELFQGFAGRSANRQSQISAR